MIRKLKKGVKKTIRNYVRFNKIINEDSYENYLNSMYKNILKYNQFIVKNNEITHAKIGKNDFMKFIFL